MSETSPKISFIPKGSLIREESFLERPRSRSAFSILAVFLFTASILAYGGLYFFNNYLETQISANLGKVQAVQKAFSKSTQVEKANNFRFRAEIVRGLLDSHIAVSPVLKFLSSNTVKSVMYSKFSFASEGGGVTVKLSGEAPTYAALAYQKEVFKKSANALLASSVNDVALTEFGTVTFTATLQFSPQYLSYAKTLDASQLTSLPTAVPVAIPLTIPVAVQSTSTSTFSLPPLITKAPAALPTRMTGTTTQSAMPFSPPGIVTPTQNPNGGYAVPSISPSASGQVTPGSASLPVNQGTRAGVAARGSLTQDSGVAAPAAPPNAPIVLPTAPASKPSILSSFWAWFKFW